MAVYNNNNEDEQTGSMLKSMGLLSFEVVFHTKDKGPGGKPLDITDGAGHRATLDAGRGERGVSVPRFLFPSDPVPRCIATTGIPALGWITWLAKGLPTLPPYNEDFFSRFLGACNAIECAMRGIQGSHVRCCCYVAWLRMWGVLLCFGS